MATDHDPVLERKGPVEVSLPHRDNVEAHASGQARLEPSTGMSFGIVLTSSILAFLFGGAGSWAYINYLDPLLTKSHQEAHPTKGQEAMAKGAATELAPRIEDISDKLSQLQSQVDHLQKPAPAPDLEPLNQRLTAMENLARKMDALEARVNTVPVKIDQDSRKITTVMADLEGMKSQVSSLRSDLLSAKKGESSADKGSRPLTQTSSEAPREIQPPVKTELGPGIELFRQKHYDQASDIFGGLTKTRPEDARVWYFAALARGLATRDWKGETERLVTQGVEREKAGKPAKAEIDSTFADLTTASGKDWLAFYRRSAR
jgi:hypothetical protein